MVPFESKREVHSEKYFHFRLGLWGHDLAGAPYSKPSIGAPITFDEHMICLPITLDR